MVLTAPTFVDFFADSGLVTQEVLHACEPVWSNHGDGHFHPGSIERVRGAAIPPGDIVWASFPCQDLSLTCKMGGLATFRSGLFWEWLRVLDEMLRKPAVIALKKSSAGSSVLSTSSLP